MTEKEIIEMRKEAFESLSAYNIFRAIDIVKDMVVLSGLRKEVSKVESISDTYGYMLHYMLEGARDDSRDQMLSGLVEELRALADMSVREVKSVASPEYYYSLYRYNRLREENVSEILKEYGSAMSELSLAEAVGNDDTELRKRTESTLERLFNTLYTSLGNREEYKELVKYISSGYADKTVIGQTISALTLSLLTFYDKSKFETLLDLYEKSDTPDMSARALGGLILTMVEHGTRIKSDTTLMSRLSLWSESLQIYQQLKETIRAIISTRDTDRVSAKMKDEVIPELLKLKPDILKSMNDLKTDADNLLENNPEWEEMLEKSGLSEKMRELSEMQSDGADLMMVTFSNLKQFPFFNQASHWFLPFDSRNTQLNLNDEMRGLVDMMHASGPMVCDSDLYSLALATAVMPETQRNIISQQFRAQLDQLNEDMKAEISKSSAPKFEREVLKVMRDYYRFFKLFRNKGGLFDPFAAPLEFRSMPVVGEMMSESDVVELIGEFYFKRGYYKEALPLLEALAEGEEVESALWEKIGFCYQSLQNYIDAEKAYEKASLLRTPGPWLIKKLAFINKKLCNYRKAADYYLQAVEMDPENPSLLLNAGQMLMKTGDVAEALQHFYHAGYINPESAKIIRAEAYGELMVGNFRKSRDLYSKLTEENLTSTDMLNSAHATMLEGDLKEARRLYLKSAELENSFENFEIKYRSDIPMLEQLGVDKSVGLLMLDSLKSKSF